MADLTYQDVQRAVQDGIRSVQGDVQRLTNDVSMISSHVQHIDELQRDVQQLQGEIQRHDPRAEMTMQQMSRDIQELKVRFEVIEKFCRDMSEYFRTKVEAEREDQEYRSMSSSS